MSEMLPPVAVARLGGCILAGGEGRRMLGADKGLIELHGEPLAALLLRQLRPQVSHLFINANRNLVRYQSLGVPVISDAITGFAGPLAGMHAVLTQRSNECDAILFVPCDAPLLAPDLGKRLCQSMTGARAAVARVAGHLQPTFALIRTSQACAMALALARGEARLTTLFQSIDAVPVDFDDCPQCFINLNSKQQLDAYLAAGGLDET